MERLINPNSGAIRFNDMNQMVAIIDKLRQYEDTGLTPEEIKNDIRVCTDMWAEKYNELKNDRDYWREEAIKWANQLGNDKILTVGLESVLKKEVERIGGKQ